MIRIQRETDTLTDLTIEQYIYIYMETPHDMLKYMQSLCFHISVNISKYKYIFKIKYKWTMKKVFINVLDTNFNLSLELMQKLN